MKFLFLLTPLLGSFVAASSTSRSVCLLDVTLFDGVKSVNSDGTYPLPQMRSTCGWSEDLVPTNCSSSEGTCHSPLADLSAGFVEGPMAITAYTSFSWPGEFRAWATEAVRSYWQDGQMCTSITMTCLDVLYYISTIITIFGCLYAACCPRRHGGKRISTTKEDLTFAKRLLVTSTLWLACGGATAIFISVGVYAAFRAWFCRGCPSGHAAVLVLLLLWWIYKIPLTAYKTGAPMERLSNPLFKLWRDYFGLTCVIETDGSSTRSSTRSSSSSSRITWTTCSSGKKRRGRANRHKRLTEPQRRRDAEDQRRREENAADKTTLIAQMPHGIMPFGSLLGIGLLADTMEGLYPIGGVVADTLLAAPLLRRAVSWLGVRRAGSKEIKEMFEDGFKAVGVVSGGVAEMFMRTETERIVSPRPNFAKIALEGGHEVRITFVFGVSRTHRMVCGSYAATKKVGFPMIFGYGAFANIPYRETMKMVVNAPMTVEKVENPSDKDVAALRKRIEAEICRLYYAHRPDWETRPLSLVRGETSDKRLKVLAARAITASSW